MLAFLVAALLTGLATRPANAQTPMPDLIVDAARLESSVDLKVVRFRDSDCAIAEGCVNAAGKRTLLRFDVGTANVGNANLELGRPSDNPDLFTYSSCHGHYHLNGFALYELVSYVDQTTVVVITGRKQAFCLLDSSRYLADAAPGPNYNCSYQGITAGWQDVYTKNLDCQWLDVTGIAAGDYYLRVTINPDGLLPESNTSNNTAEVAVRISGRGRR